MKNHSSQDTTLDISIIGLMSALVFVGTYFFKIPSAFGYTHLGDCMIILSAYLAQDAASSPVPSAQVSPIFSAATRYGFSRPWY